MNDLQGRILDGNRAAEILTGRDRQEIVGRSFVEAGLVDPDYQSNAMHLLKQGAEGLATGPDELLMRRKNGEPGWIEVVTVPMDMDGTRVILDRIMGPGMNGRETWEEIQRIHPNQKALIASGFTETEDVKQTQAAGAGAYIKKPYTLEKLGRAVKEELSSFKAISC